jgi:hypothetical protein
LGIKRNLRRERQKKSARINPGASKSFYPANAV